LVGWVKLRAVSDKPAAGDYQVLLVTCIRLPLWNQETSNYFKLFRHISTNATMDALQDIGTAVEMGHTDKYRRSPSPDLLVQVGPLCDQTLLNTSC
jgi:hypothetical protein